MALWDTAKNAETADFPELSCPARRARAVAFTPSAVAWNAGMNTLEPLAISPREAAAMLAISRRSVSRLIRARKLIARKHGARTLVDAESVKAFYAALPIKQTSSPIVFGRRAKRQQKPRR